MSHLSSEDILGYLDGEKSIVDLNKASRHLDKCDRCTSKLKDFATLSILLELITVRIKEQREKEILGNCPDAEIIFNLIRNRLSVDERIKIEKHLKECEYCQEELEVIRAIEETPEAKAPEIREPERFLPKILRYFELYFVACEREIVIREEKGFRIPGLKTIREMLLPRQPVLVPLGFAELTKRDLKFYCELDDSQIMQACKRGDNMAWKVLVQRFINYASKIIYDYGLMEEWEDIWQETMFVLATKIKDYEERGRAKFFLRKIVINKCRKWRRKKIRDDKILKRMSNQVQPKTRTSYQEKKLIEKEETKHLIENIKKMPKEFSTVLMALIDGLNDKEIAHLLNIPIETVRTRKFRARTKLLEMKSNDLEFLSKINRFEWVKRKFYKFFTP